MDLIAVKPKDPDGTIPDSMVTTSHEVPFGYVGVQSLGVVKVSRIPITVSL